MLKAKVPVTFSTPSPSIIFQRLMDNDDMQNYDMYACISSSGKL